jgi:hypothetical protein
MAGKKATGSRLPATGGKKRPAARKNVPVVATHREQTARWVEGDSVHVRVGSSWECCPDFSCCYPALRRPKAERLAFASADAPAREAFYSAALGALVRHCSGVPGRVHVVGQVPRRS